MRWRIRPSPHEGIIEVPGDKSIAHRAIMFAALADGTSEIRNLPLGEDVLSTAGCIRALGARVDISPGGATLTGAGKIAAPEDDLDAGNSGTTMRLLSGILAGQEFDSRLVGDSSLQRRPMNRVIEPLEQMGARIDSNAGRAPLAIHGQRLHAIRYRLPVDSAQVKSAILLAGLFAEGATTVEEPRPTRDHTERMLTALGVQIERGAGTVSVRRNGRLPPFRLRVPGDFSSAAFFFSAGALAGTTVTVRNVGVNPTRIGFLNVLERMGARVEVKGVRDEGGEPVGDVTVSGRVERGVNLSEDEVPQLVDEIPLIVLLATQVQASLIQGAGELRVKEVDRIEAVAEPLIRMGADIDSTPDGFVVRGPTPLRGALVSSRGDHRIAMMLAVAGSIAHGETVVEGAEAAAVSYPTFIDDFVRLGGSVGS